MGSCGVRTAALALVQPASGKLTQLPEPTL